MAVRRHARRAGHGSSSPSRSPSAHGLRHGHADPGRLGCHDAADGSVGATYDGNGTYAGGTILENVTIAYGGGGGSSGALVIGNTAPYLDALTVENSAASGIYVNGDGGSARLDAPVLTNNAGDGLTIIGGYQVPASTVTISGATVTGNAGAGIDATNSGPWCAQPTVAITNSLFSGNGSYGVYSWEASLSVEAVTVTNNLGGGIYFGTAEVPDGLTIADEHRVVEHRERHHHLEPAGLVRRLGQC